MEEKRTLEDIKVPINTVTRGFALQEHASAAQPLRGHVDTFIWLVVFRQFQQRIGATWAPRRNGRKPGKLVALRCFRENAPCFRVLRGFVFDLSPAFSLYFLSMHIECRRAILVAPFDRKRRRWRDPLRQRDALAPRPYMLVAGPGGSAMSSGT